MFFEFVYIFFISRLFLSWKTSPRIIISWFPVALLTHFKFCAVQNRTHKFEAKNMNIIRPPYFPFRVWFVHFVWFLPRFTWLSASTMSFWLTPHKLAVSRSHFLWQFTSHSGSRVSIRFLNFKFRRGRGCGWMWLWMVPTHNIALEGN